MKNTELIGKEFDLNGFICTVTSIDKTEVKYSFRNKAGKEFGNACVGISFLPNIISQQKQQAIVKPLVVPREPIIDLFEQVETLPAEVQRVIKDYMHTEFTYESCEQMHKELEPLGYTFEWYLDALPFNLRLITT